MYDIPTFERGQDAVECSLVRRSAERRAGGVAFELAPDDGGCACNLTLEPGKAVEAGLQSELDGLRQRSSIQCRATLTRILGELFDEERVALGMAHETLQRLHRGPRKIELCHLECGTLRKRLQLEQHLGAELLGPERPVGVFHGAAEHED